MRAGYEAAAAAAAAAAVEQKLRLIRLAGLPSRDARDDTLDGRDFVRLCCAGLSITPPRVT